MPDATRFDRSTVPKVPEFQELYAFDAAAKTLGDALAKTDPALRTYLPDEAALIRTI